MTSLALVRWQWCRLTRKERRMVPVWSVALLGAWMACIWLAKVIEIITAGDV